MPESFKTRGPKSVLVTIALVTLAYLGVAELALRFLPVASGLHAVAVDEVQPIFHFEPNRAFTYSHGWNLRDVVHGRINNAGWVNGQDYVRDDPTPLIAVVGDSYIEAEMVPYAETLQGRLAAALRGEFRVYSFAAAGAPLSEFPIYADYAVREFGASAVVFAITEYDFARSDLAYGPDAGFWVYAGRGSDLRPRLLPYHPSWLREAARRSSLVRYVMLNLRAGEVLGALQGAAGVPGVRPAAAAVTGSPARAAASAAVVSTFFHELGRDSALSRTRIAFLLDGVRYPERVGPAKGSYDDRMRENFRTAAAAAGYAAIDLDPLFFRRHRESGIRFDFPFDPHWNGNGHAVAAEALLGSPWLGELRRRTR